MIAKSMGSYPSDIESWVAKAEIRECLLRFPLGTFRQDAEMCLSAYWPEAIEKHGDFDGPVEEFIRLLMPRLAAREITFNQLGNTYIRLEEDRAHAETFSLSCLRNRAFDGSVADTVVGSQYVDLLERRRGEWRILRRDATTLWQASYGAEITGAITAIRPNP